MRLHKSHSVEASRAQPRRHHYRQIDGAFNRLARVDWLLVFAITGLVIIGTAMLYSAAGGNTSPWASRHLIRFGIGLALMLTIAFVGIQHCFKVSYFAYGLCFILLIVVELVGSGTGATRWLDIGIMRLQPSELMKVALILALARLLHNASIESSNRIHVLGPAILMILAPSALVLRQPDLGTAMLIVIGGIVLLFLGGVALRKFGIAAALACVVAPIAWFMLHDYQRSRILTFLQPDKDPLGAGYHILQSFIAMGSGGLFGKGWLKGTQAQLSFLPEKHTDFVFTMLGEELGLAGCVFVLLLFTVTIFRLYKIGLLAEARFTRLVALGVATTLFLYVFINVAMVMGLMPVVGVPLPFISFGGTAMLTLQVGLGVALAGAIDLKNPLQNMR
ncbi:MAG: rod shape-determining protein RodA [Rhodospirillales bacterium]|jgi:rod shape determining protein RodA